VRHFSSGENQRDFYNVLGVSRDADKSAIKKAYFKLAKEYHPDRNKDDAKAAEKFKEATNAYEVLSDEKQRQLYDQFGHAGVDPNSGFQQGGNPFGQGFEGFEFRGGPGAGFEFHSGGPGEEIDAEELFDMFFGGGRRRPRGPRRGADLQMHVSLNFREAVFGCEKDLNLRYQVRKKGGKVEIKEREVTVTVPAGIDNGMNLRLQGQGAEGDPGAPSGNLMVQIIVREDDYFNRDGADVHTEIGVSVVQAILGGTVDVKTLGGEVEVTVPKGTQMGAKLMLRGKGIQRLNGRGKGNHYVHLNIEIPKSLTKRQEELLREFDEESRSSGSGISGRIAKAAGSAFDTLFGTKSSEGSAKSSKEPDAGDETVKTKDTHNNTKDDTDVDEKRQQTA